MGIFYREKAFLVGKKSGKMTLPPQEKNPLTLLLFSRVCLFFVYLFVFVFVFVLFLFVCFFFYVKTVRNQMNF